MDNNHVYATSTMNKIFNRSILRVMSMLTMTCVILPCCAKDVKKSKVKEPHKIVCKYRTPNITPGRNKVQGVILHHTACRWQTAVGKLISPKSKTSTHVVIAMDGTRYVLAPPTAITWHAGRSWMNGKSNCNRFTIGIEFEGNTCILPLTDAQINSAIEYLLPIIKKYHIPLRNIRTHQQVREAWNKRFPKRKTWTKVDITDKEYKRFMKELRKNYKGKKK